MENYLAALQNCNVVEESTIGERFSCALLTIDNERFVIKDWKCECRELERTGVACSHLIAATMYAKGRSYL